MQKRNLKPILFHVISAFYESGQVNIQARDRYLQDINNQTSRGSSRLLVAAAFVRLQVNAICRLSGLYTTALSAFHSNTSLSGPLENFQQHQPSRVIGRLPEQHQSSRIIGWLQRQHQSSRVIGGLSEATVDFQGHWRTFRGSSRFPGSLADFQRQ